MKRVWQIFQILTITICTPMIAVGAPDPKAVELEITSLLNAIRHSGCEFERNGTRHPAPKAADHLSDKLDKAAAFWFAPKKADWTAEMFIERLASKSSLSGKPYMIICLVAGKVQPVKSADWLQDKLKSIRQKPTVKPTTVPASAAEPSRPATKK